MVRENMRSLDTVRFALLLLVSFRILSIKFRPDGCCGSILTFCCVKSSSSERFQKDKKCQKDKNTRPVTFAGRSDKLPGIGMFFFPFSLNPVKRITVALTNGRLKTQIKNPPIVLRCKSENLRYHL